MIDYWCSVRIFPHYQNTGGFFFAVFKKMKPMPPSAAFLTCRSLRGRDIKKDKEENEKEGDGGETEEEEQMEEEEEVAMMEEQAFGIIIITFKHDILLYYIIV